MHKAIVNYLKCPACGGDLREESFANDGEDIIDGRLICNNCLSWQRIQNGIADMLPESLRDNEKYLVFARKHSLPHIQREQGERDKDKLGQMEFFEVNVEDYEREVVDSRYYKALDEYIFIEWANKYLKSGDIVLDIGCGTGRQCLPLAERNIKTIGLDISEDMLNLARKKASALGVSGQTDFIIGDGENPPVKGNSFNACIIYGVLHHVKDKQGAIASASEKIVANGHFLALDPHDSTVRFLFDFLMRIWKLYDEEASDDPLISEEQMLTWMSKAGLTGETMLSTYLPPHLFHFLNLKMGKKLLKISDRFFGNIPLIDKFAGVVVSYGVKTCSNNSN